MNSGQTGIGILDNEVEFFGGSKPTSHEIEDLGSAEAQRRGPWRSSSRLEIF